MKMFKGTCCVTSEVRERAEQGLGSMFGCVARIFLLDYVFSCIAFGGSFDHVLRLCWSHDDVCLFMIWHTFRQFTWCGAINLVNCAIAQIGMIYVVKCLALSRSNDSHLIKCDSATTSLQRHWEVVSLSFLHVNRRFRVNFFFLITKQQKDARDYTLRYLGV